MRLYEYKRSQRPNNNQIEIQNCFVLAQSRLLEFIQYFQAGAFRGQPVTALRSPIIAFTQTLILGYLLNFVSKLISSFLFLFRIFKTFYNFINFAQNKIGAKTCPKLGRPMKSHETFLWSRTDLFPFPSIELLSDVLVFLFSDHRVRSIKVSFYNIVSKIQLKGLRFITRVLPI